MLSLRSKLHIGISRVTSSVLIMVLLLTFVTSGQAYEYSRKENASEIALKIAIEEALRPIKKLNSKSSIDEITKEAAKFKKKLDKIYPTNISLDDAFALATSKCSESNIHFNKKSLKAIQKKIKGHISGKTLVSKKGSGGEDVPERVVIGYVEVFCGVLIAMIPFPVCEALGTGLIINGLNEIINGQVENRRNMHLLSPRKKYGMDPRRNDQNL